MRKNQRTCQHRRALFLVDLRVRYWHDLPGGHLPRKDVLRGESIHSGAVKWCITPGGLVYENQGKRTHVAARPVAPDPMTATRIIQSAFKVDCDLRSPEILQTHLCVYIPTWFL